MGEGPGDAQIFCLREVCECGCSRCWGLGDGDGKEDSEGNEREKVQILESRRERERASQHTMSNHRLRNTLRLFNRRTKLLKQFKRQHTAIKLKRHECSSQILLRGPNVVQEAGEEIRLAKGGGGP